ncbi:MAG: hypothetical protein AAF449_22115, partial [Myxococcota bacterium]
MTNAADQPWPGGVRRGMPRCMNVSPQGFFVRYESRRALDADHAAYMAHGGMMVQIDPAEAPEPRTPAQLRIEGPEGIELVVSAKV